MATPYTTSAQYLAGQVISASEDLGRKALAHFDGHEDRVAFARAALDHAAATMAVAEFGVQQARKCELSGIAAEGLIGTTEGAS